MEQTELGWVKIDHALTAIDLFLRAYPNSFVALSGGKDSLVVMHLARRINPDVKLVYVNTGYEFVETINYVNKLTKGCNIHIAGPTMKDKIEIAKRYEVEPGGVTEHQVDGQYICCAHKKPAIEPWLAKSDGWITGVRMDETEERVHMSLLNNSSPRKLNPIFYWTEEEVWDYIKKFGLPVNPLYRTFDSLGCWLCTSHGRRGQFQAIGERQECGLHV